MEFVSISRIDSTLLPGSKFDFEELKVLDRVKVDHFLNLVDDPVNIELFNSYVQQGFGVVSVVKKHPCSLEGRINFPRRVMLEHTSHCNMKCSMCPRQNLKRADMHMDINIAKKIIDEVDFHGIEGIWLYHLGESFMYPHLDEVFDYLRLKKNLGYIWFSTNGHMMTDKNIDRLLDSPVTHLNYSLHSTNEEIFEKVSPTGDYKTVKGNFDRLVKKIKVADNPPILHLQMIEQSMTRHITSEFLKLYHNMSDIVSINFLEYASLPNNKYGLSSRSRKQVSNCRRLMRGDCFVLSDGDVEPCDAAYNGELSLGNVNESNLFDIWNGKNMTDLVKLNNKGRLYEVEHCAKCTDYDL